MREVFATAAGAQTSYDPCVTELVGRGSELERLTTWLVEARAGRPRVAVVDGPAGIGKTALLRSFVRTHAEQRLVWVSGYENETLLSGGVLDQLWHAVGPAEPAPNAPDHISAGAALLRWLDTDLDERAVVVVVDDAQWADTMSMNAIAFALRRLRVEPVLVIMAVRTEDLDRLPASVLAEADSAGTRLALGGLDRDALAHLARAHQGRALGEFGIRRLAEYSGGNPLYARALLDEVPIDELADPAAPLAAPRSLSAMILHRLAECGEPARSLVRAAAVLGPSCRVVTAQRLAGLADPADALDDAAAADLAALRPGSDRMAFTHPLVRAAVYHDLPPGTRAALHGRAAELIGTGVEALRHRIAATLVEDGVLAAEVLRAARAEELAGSWASAADLFQAVRRLSTDPAARRRALGRAAECLMLGGDARAAIAVARELEQLPSEPLRDQVLGNIAIIVGERDRGIELLARAWRNHAGSEDAEVAALAANQLGMEALNDGDAAAAIEWSQRALDYPMPPALRGMPHCVIALADGLLGNAATRLAAMPPLPYDVADLHGEQLALLLGRGMLKLWSGDLLGAIEDLRHSDEAAQRYGPVYLRLLSLTYRADAEYRAGRWDDSLLHGELAATLAEGAGSVLMLGFAASVASFAASGRGEHERAAALLADAERAAAALRAPATRLWVSVGRARAAHAAGDAEAGLAALEWFAAERTRDGRDETGVQPWALLYAEALLDLGERERASDVLAAIVHNGIARQLGAVLVGAYRLRARAAGTPEDARADFDRALALIGPRPVTLEENLAHFDFGRWLYRNGEREGAAREFAVAHRGLVALGAQPYVQRCAVELGRCGQRPPIAEGVVIRSLLTAQENAVAMLIATGATNRQAAAELVVSVKTIEFHLGNVFRKLGVSTRYALIARFHEAGLA